MSYDHLFDQPATPPIILDPTTQSTLGLDSIDIGPRFNHPQMHQATMLIMIIQLINVDHTVDHTTDQ
eukprot:m.150037 g.150037  ORF g.150037 m.150037 type:complete len:67 (+) comp30703_c0_seq2:409-609(+)